jgi:hypothetical protein
MECQAFRIVSRTRGNRGRCLQDGVLTVDGQAVDPQPVATGGIRQREHWERVVSAVSGQSPVGISII